MIHPLRDVREREARGDAKKRGPFDPQDLTRRLAKYLAEQKFRAEKRREARAVKTTALAHESALLYHHVPQVAATQFERTMTPDVLRSVRKLSQPAIKAHLELLILADSPQSLSSTALLRTQAMDQAAREKELLRNRNQFQWTHDMKEAAIADAERPVQITAKDI
ncbi:hypothetical protein QTJ16_004920 [Diplocarpon rosae]|uniref:Uncharacterized protein n=1 Tax=Diplocarpon rosae TaxID=946125 RepID=A0AAD9WCW2_9HELO|nr:hypothetical protein QTJ16_004920 [Diplocarpon rosae]PBP21337.1 hypothetical protein BUE80_DR007942 [Diplocarpon rosae]